LKINKILFGCDEIHFPKLWRKKEKMKKSVIDGKAKHLGLSVGSHSEKFVFSSRKIKLSGELSFEGKQSNST